MNQITIGLIDFNRTGLLPESEALPDDNENERALQHLDELKSTRPQFVDSIRTLYDNIKVMSEYNDTLSVEDRAVVTQLAARLQADVNRYVLSDPHKAANPRREYLLFKQAFTARLHSQDVIIKKYRPLWAIVLSVVVAIVSLGTQPLYSKLNSGRFSFFFEDAAPIRKEIASMEKAVSEPPQFVAVA